MTTDIWTVDPNASPEQQEAARRHNEEMLYFAKLEAEVYGTDWVSVEVISSNIRAVGYDKAWWLLLVEFNTGARYSYEAVPYYEFWHMINAESVGKYFAERIRKNATYIHAKLEE